MPKAIDQDRERVEIIEPGTEVAVVRLQLSFSDVFILAVQFGIIWFLMGLGGVLLYRALT